MNFSIKACLIVSVLGISINVQAQDAVLKNYQSTDSTSWLMPAAYNQGQIIDYKSFPNDAFNFNIGYGSYFKSTQVGKINSYRFFLEQMNAEKSDSVVSYAASHNDSIAWKFNQKVGDETFEKFAQLVQAPYVGQLESISIPSKKVFSGDGFNDSLIIRFHPPLLSVTSSESYFNNGIVWFFGLPRTTNNVSQYGVRFTAPGTEGSVKLQAVDFYIFSINDTRFYSNYDIPANDSLIVRIYNLDANNLPKNTLATRKYAFSELSAGFDNRFDFSDLNIQFPAGTSYVVATEVKRVDKQDYIGLVSGTSFDTPKDRTIMFENDGWIYLSQSASWGGGGAKGAEIRATAIYEDPNNKTPNTTQEIAPYVAVSFSALAESGLNSVKLKNPVRLYEGEEVWVSFEQRIRGFRDSVAVYSDTLSKAVNESRSAFYGKNGTEKFWYFTQNSPSIHKNVNFKVASTFSFVLNDRLTVDLFRVDGLQNRVFETGTSIPLNRLKENSWNEIDVSELNIDIAENEQVFAAISLFSIQNSDGISIRTDKGNASRTSANTFIKTSKQVNGSNWTALTDTNYPELWAELTINNLPTSIDEFEQGIPNQSELLGVYPNPFNPTTTIRYALKSAENVRLRVFDILGKEVSYQEIGIQSAGEHRIQFNATGLSSGMYIYQLQLNSTVLTGKMTLIK